MIQLKLREDEEPITGQTSPSQRACMCASPLKNQGPLRQGRRARDKAARTVKSLSSLLLPSKSHRFPTTPTRVSAQDFICDIYLAGAFKCWKWKHNGVGNRVSGCSQFFWTSARGYVAGSPCLRGLKHLVSI